MTRKPSRSPRLHEALFAPSSLADVVALERALVEHAGATESAAAGCAMWVLRRGLGADGKTDAVSEPTRARYRKMLGALVDIGWPGPNGSRGRGQVVELEFERSRRTEGGRIRPAVSAMAAAAMAVVLAFGPSAAPGASGATAWADGHATAPAAPLEAQRGGSAAENGRGRRRYGRRRAA